MRKTILFLLAVACLGLSGCGTKSSYTALTSDAHVDPSATFSVGSISDNSGHVFGAGDADTFDLATEMKRSLQAELTKHSAFAEQGKYTININIVKYSPGNAGLRWLLPGAGATALSIENEIVDEQGTPLARIPVERTIAAGGGYTIGAWKYVFQEVSEELVSILRDEKQRKASKKNTE